MSTYLYHCDDCALDFEETHPMNDILEECPICKEKGLPAKKPKRLIAAGTNFILVGGGWAKEGYK